LVVEGGMGPKMSGPAGRDTNPYVAYGATVVDCGLLRRTFAESTSRRRLSFEEVVQAGLPAAFRDFGEALVFLDGKLFDVSQPEAVVELPLDDAGPVNGLEFGWRHAVGCRCRFCQSVRRSPSARSTSLRPSRSQDAGRAGNPGVPWH
jgi:hypothetical protein